MSLFSNTFNNADNNHNRNNNNNSNDNDNDNNNNNVSAWAPEDSNLTLCSGAAAAAAAASSSSLSSGEGGKRRALFCDPDQVLDRETLLSVALKLCEFVNSFPYGYHQGDGVW